MMNRILNRIFPSLVAMDRFSHEDLKYIGKTKIKEMPSKETLERFLDGMQGRVSVYFDSEKGIFVDYEKK